MLLTLRLVVTILELSAAVAIMKCRRYAKLYEKNMVCHLKAITVLSATRMQSKSKAQAIQETDLGFLTIATRQESLEGGYAINATEH
jgi:hypothetical protein